MRLCHTLRVVGGKVLVLGTAHQRRVQWVWNAGIEARRVGYTARGAQSTGLRPSLSDQFCIILQRREDAVDGDGASRLAIYILGNVIVV